jgi:hypothetical protein
MYSKDGYKRNSKDKNRPYNVIPSGRISMKDVDFPVMGIDDLGYSELMTPGGEYKFPGSTVLEVPAAQLGFEIPDWLNPYNYERTGDKNPVASFLSGEFQMYPTIDAANFESAFAKAQEQYPDKPFFIWNGKRYKNDLRGETRHKPTQEILDRIKNAEDLDPKIKENFLNLWSDLNQPNLNISDHDNEFSFGPWSWSEMGLDEGRDHVNPLSDPGGGSLYIKQKKYHNKPEGDYDIYNFETDHHNNLIDALLNELTHVKQQNDMGRIPYIKRYIKELVSSGFDQNKLYSIVGSLEHEAHGDVLRELEKEVYGEAKSTGDYAEEREGHTHEHEYGGEGGRTTALRNFMYDKKRNKDFAQYGKDLIMNMGDVQRAKEEDVDADYKQMTTLSTEDEEIQKIRENINYTPDITKEDVELYYNFIPVTGEVIDAKNTGKALGEGKLGEALLHALGFTLPFIPGGALVKGLKKGKNKFKKGLPAPEFPLYRDRPVISGKNYGAPGNPFVYHRTDNITEKLDWEFLKKGTTPGYLEKIGVKGTNTPGRYKGIWGFNTQYPIHANPHKYEGWLGQTNRGTRTLDPWGKPAGYGHRVLQYQFRPNAKILDLSDRGTSAIIKNAKHHQALLDEGYDAILGKGETILLNANSVDNVYEMRNLYDQKMLKEFPDMFPVYKYGAELPIKQGGGATYEYPTPKMVNEYYNPSESALTDEERSAIVNWVDSLQDSTKSLGTYYMMDDGDGTVFYESSNPDIKDISFSSPDEYNNHRRNLGLPEDWTLIEKRVSDKLKDSAITNKLNAIDTDQDLDVNERLSTIEPPDTTARMDNLSNIPMTDKLKQIESTKKLNEVATIVGDNVNEISTSSSPEYPMLYHHQLKDINKGKINRELNKNIEKNNIKILEAEKNKQRQEMHDTFYGKYELKDYDIDTLEEVKDIQQMLVDNGYNVGKYKYGEKAGEDLIDGYWGPLTEEAYASYLNDKFNNEIAEKTSIISGDYDFSELQNNWRCDEKGCASGMFNMYADIVGWPAVREAGMIGDAWTIKSQMEKAGADIKYNVYANKSKPDYENLHSFTTNALKNNPLDYSILEEGDVVGIYSSTSGYNNRALNEGKGTYNSHIGMISGYDTDGMPIVTHNLNGWVEHDRADEVQGLSSKHPMQITWVADPLGGEGFKYSQTEEGKSDWKDYSDENKIYIDFLEAKFFDHTANTIAGKELQYWDAEEKRIINDNINHVKNNVSKIVDELGIPMDENALTQIVLGILGTESQFGLRKLDENPTIPFTNIEIDDRDLKKLLINTYQDLPFEPFGPKEKDLDGDGHISDDEKLQAYDRDSQEVSKGIAKMKLSKLDNFTKKYFNIDENTIENDKTSINVLIAKTARAKHLLTEYSKANPKLGLGDMDLWNMAALVHNQGDDILMHFGSNPEYTIDEQVKRLKNLYEGRVSAVDATNWKHVANLSQDESWKDLVEVAYQREQMASYIKKHPEIFNQLPDPLKGQVKYLTERNNLRDILQQYKVSGKLGERNINNKLKKGIGTLLWGQNLFSTGGVKAFDMEDLRPYFDNDDHFEYAKGSESYISKVRRYANLYEREVPFEDIWYTREGQKTRAEIIEEVLMRNGNYEALVEALDPAYEDMLIGQYYQENLQEYPRYQEGGSVKVPTEEEARKNPRYNRDMDEDGIPVGIDIDDSTRVPKELMLLQSMKESSLDPTKVSDKGAKGLTQIRPDTLEDYIKATGDKDVDVFDWKDSMKIQDWYMNNLYNRPWINKQNQSQDVRLAKTLAAYNWGPKVFNEFLNRKKSEGINIYDADMAWVKDLPIETRDYINTVLLRKNEEFEGWVNDWNQNEDKKLFIDAYKEEYKKGGSLIYPAWKRIKKHWKKYLSGKAINPDMYEKLVAYGFIKKRKYRKPKRKARNLKSVPSNIILNSIDLGKMKKGGDLEKQVRIYEDYVNGIFDNTLQKEKAIKAYDKMNRLYLYDSRDKGLPILDYMKKKLKDK